MDQIGITGISKRFNDTIVLKNINLSVKSGEFLSILGPSGCGKSTLLRIIAGLEDPTSGDIVIAGKNVTKEPVWKRKIGFVFQNFALWPHLSVLGNVTMGLELRGVGKAERTERALGALRQVQLEALADRYPSQLSGGQQQRVSIARAIVLEPTVLLLDEPLSSLDKNLRQDMQVELKTLQQKLKLTTIFVTHDQEEAMSLSDRIAVMNEGAVEQIDVPENIYSRPSTSYVARFVGETTFFEGRVEPGANGSILRTADGALIPLQSGTEVGSFEAKAFVRPEWIQLKRMDRTSSEHMLTGRIERIMFFGSTSDFLVRQGSRLIRIKSAGGSKEFRQGDEVALEFTACLLPRK